MKRLILVACLLGTLLVASDSYPRGISSRGGGYERPAGDGYRSPSFGDAGRYGGGRAPDNREPYRGDDANRGLGLDRQPGFRPGERPGVDNRNFDNRNIDNRGIDNRNIGDRNIDNQIGSRNINSGDRNWNWGNQTVNRSGTYSPTRNVTNNVTNSRTVQGNTVNTAWRNGYYNGAHSWVHGYWNWPGRYPACWGYGWGGAGAVAAAGWAAPSEVNVYSNPYYVQTTAAPYDYSQPLPAPPAAPSPAPPADGGAPPQPGDTSAPTVPPDATRAFDAARAAFKQSDYPTALREVDRAIKVLPSDATLHEFRALVLFAQKKYQEEAATLHAVLASGPGWDWTTVEALYPDTETYTKQLRALEAYREANPKDAAAAFDLAYQYMMTGYPDAAGKQLQAVVQLQPKDTLAAQMLAAIKKPDSGRRRRNRDRLTSANGVA